MGFVWSMSTNLNIWDMFWMKQVQMEKNAVGRWRAGGGLQVSSRLVHARDLQLECARVLHETSLVPVLMYGSETYVKRKI